MKTLFLSTLVCVCVSMSAFTVIKKHHTNKNVNTQKTVISWPVTGNAVTIDGAIVTYSIGGIGQIPVGISFGNDGPYEFVQIGTNLYEADIRTSNINRQYVKMGINPSSIGYSVDFIGLK